MRKIYYFTIVLVLVFSNMNLLFADDAEFQIVTIRNDMTVGGELHLDLQMRMTSGTSPRTLNSTTIDIDYGTELTEWDSDPSINWAFSFLDGYSRSAQRNSGFYRVLVTGPNVNANGNPTPPGDPAGWDVTTTWQTMCTLRWTINTATSVSISINDATDAAAHFDNYTNAPQGGVTDFTVTNQDIGDISLPVELTSFKANVTSDLDVNLVWVIESEINNMGFEVYRSEVEDSAYSLLSSFTSNSDLAGHGNSSTKHTYKYTDKTVLRNNTYWYKICDVDINGVRNYYGPLSVLVEPGELGGEEPKIIPDEFQLSQNYPNPFNPETRIQVGIPDEKNNGEIIINIYDVIGKKIKTLFHGNLEPGIHTVKWDGSDAAGNQVSGGTYFYYLKSNKFHQIKKMIFMK